MSGPSLVGLHQLSYNFTKVTHEDSCAESSREACVKAPWNLGLKGDGSSVVASVPTVPDLWTRDPFLSRKYCEDSQTKVWHLQFWAHHKANKETCRKTGPYYKARIIESSLWPRLGNFVRAPKYKEHARRVFDSILPNASEEIHT